MDDLKSISLSKRRQFSSRDPLDAARTEEQNKTTRMPCSSVLRIVNENGPGEQASLMASETNNPNRNENSDEDEAALFFKSVQHDDKMELENDNLGGVTEHQDPAFHMMDASAPIYLDKSIRKLGPKLNSVNRRQARMESSLQRLEAKCDLIIHSVAQLVTKSQQEPHSIQQAQQLLQTVSSPSLSTDAHCLDSVFQGVSDYNSIKCQPFGTCLEDPFHNVPLEYKMSMRVLEKLKSQSSGPGNFAVKISERLYPELFTAENLRLKYSYFGGGVLNKQELDPQRKEILQRYVLSFYPEYQNPDLWKGQIVAKVNENLRRPVQRKRVKIPDKEW